MRLNCGQDDLYESLEVPYHAVNQIYLSFHSPDGQALVSVQSSMAPLVGTKPMSQVEETESYVVEFTIERNRFLDFTQALISRGLVRSPTVPLR